MEEKKKRGNPNFRKGQPNPYRKAKTPNELSKNLQEAAQNQVD